MGLEYVDIFYHHRPDPDTPQEETMGALAQAVRRGRALYAGISSYTPEQTRRAATLLNDLGVPCVIHQPKYSMLVRGPENGLFQALKEEGIGCIPFSPLAQGLLTDRYLRGIPADSRAAKAHGFLRREEVSEQRVDQARRLNEIAKARGQSLAQLAIAWVLREPVVTSALIGASRIAQIDDAIGALARRTFDAAELGAIDKILA
jgi:L-glyceraldehyde 3-phosphate reductase